MKFIYHECAGDSHITLQGDVFHHVFGVRRAKNKDFRFANLRDNNIYRYNLTHTHKKEASFDLGEILPQKTQNPTTHIIQAIIDMNEFGKILHILNELLVKKISLFYADFSQRNYKINIERLQKILINSSMQCGRLSLLEIEIFENLESALETYGEAVALDFDGESCNIAQNNHIIIGPEGGFSQRERELFMHRGIKKIALPHSITLRASTACIFATSVCFGR